MSHAQAYFVDRTDPYRPIPKQQIHRESITGPARTKTPKTRRDDFLAEVHLPSTTKNDRKQQTRSARKERKRLAAQDLEAVYSQNAQEKQEENEQYASYMQEKQEIYEQQQKEIIEKAAAERAQKEYQAHVPAPPENSQKQYTRPQERVHNKAARPRVIKEYQKRSGWSEEDERKRRDDARHSDYQKNRGHTSFRRSTAKVRAANRKPWHQTRSSAETVYYNKYIA